MRNLAVIPPMMLDVRQRRMRFLNNNGLLEDPVAVSKEQNHLGRWTEQEKQIFKEKYLQHPKNFSLIATFLPRKVRIFFFNTSCVCENFVLYLSVYAKVRMFLTWKRFCMVHQSFCLCFWVYVGLYLYQETWTQ